MQRKRIELLVVVSIFCVALGMIANHYHQQTLQDRFLDAVERDDAPTVIGMLDRGVDPINRKPIGVTALRLAASRRARRTVSALLKRGAKPASDELYAPAMAGEQEIVEALLQAGADPNFVVQETRPFLMELAMRGTPGMLKLVIDHGAPVNGKYELTWYGQHTLMAAIITKRMESAKVLLDAGADADAQVSNPQSKFDGYTCLMLAAQNGQTDAVKLLLAHHADVNIIGADGQTALRLAQKGHNAAVVALLQQTAQQNRRPHAVSQSSTAGHLAPSPADFSPQNWGVGGGGEGVRGK